MRATRPVALARRRKFDIFNPELFLAPLLRAAFQSGLTAVEQSEAIFPFEASPPAPAAGNPSARKTEKLGNPDTVKGTQRDTDTERHTRSAIMPIILRRSAVNVDTLCSGMIQFMTTVQESTRNHKR